MSVIIKGIDKHPVSCFECPLINGSDECALLDSDQNFIYDDLDLAQTKMCPIIGALPEKHGRLIDADAFIKHLEKEFADGYEKDQKSDADMKMLIAKMHELIITEIRKRPTVIESEE